VGWRVCAENGPPKVSWSLFFVSLFAFCCWCAEETFSVHFYVQFTTLALFFYLVIVNRLYDCAHTKSHSSESRPSWRSAPIQNLIVVRAGHPDAPTFPMKVFHRCTFTNWDLLCQYHVPCAMCRVPCAVRCFPPAMCCAFCASACHLPWWVCVVHCAVCRVKCALTSWFLVHVQPILKLFKKTLFAERWVCLHHHVDFLRIFVNASCRWSCLWATWCRPKHHDLSITDFSQCPRHGLWHPRSITCRDSFVLVFNLPCSYHSPPPVTLLLFLFVVVWLFTLIRVSSPVTHSWDFDVYGNRYQSLRETKIINFHFCYKKVLQLPWRCFFGCRRCSVWSVVGLVVRSCWFVVNWVAIGDERGQCAHGPRFWDFDFYGKW
jgi:hypothetical protein